RLRPLERGETARQRAQQVLVEAGSDFAGEMELALLIVQADEQRTEAVARAARGAVPADHEILQLPALELDPALRASGDVDRSGLLERPAQALLALAQRQATQVLPGKEGRIEGEICDLGVATGVERVLQGLEVRASIGAGHDDLAVEPAVSQAQRGERRGDVRQLRGPVVARTGE